METLDPEDYPVSGCYLVCARTPYVARSGQQQKQARHYLGSADNIALRFRRHKQGNGGRLLAVMNEAGIEYDLLVVWPSEDARALEVTLKRGQHIGRLCPRCGAEVKARMKQADRARYNRRKQAAGGEIVTPPPADHATEDYDNLPF